MASKQPTHILRMAVPDREGYKPGWDTVGALWLEDDGKINVTINRGCVLDWRLIHLDGCRLMAIPNTRGEDE